MVVTGTFELGGRGKVSAALRELGIQPSSAVSASTTAVIAGASPGKAKITKAEKLGVPVVAEGDLPHWLKAQGLAAGQFASDTAS